MDASYASRYGIPLQHPIYRAEARSQSSSPSPSESESEGPDYEKESPRLPPMPTLTPPPATSAKQLLSTGPPHLPDGSMKTFYYDEGGPEHVIGGHWPLAAAGSSTGIGISTAPPPAGHPPQRPKRPDPDDVMLEPPRAPPPTPLARPAQPAGPKSSSDQMVADIYRAVASNYHKSSDHQESSAPPAAMSEFSFGSLNAPTNGSRYGPPPSARKGPASYYPQISQVPPIAEETESVRSSVPSGSTPNPAHSSYASSHAIPTYYTEESGRLPQPLGMIVGSPSVEMDYNTDYFFGHRKGAAGLNEIQYNTSDRRDWVNVTKTAAGPTLRIDPTPRDTASSTPDLARNDSAMTSRSTSLNRARVQSPVQQSDLAVGGGPVVSTPGARSHSRGGSKTALSIQTNTSRALSSGTGYVESSSDDSEREFERNSPQGLPNVTIPRQQSQHYGFDPVLFADPVLIGGDHGPVSSAWDSDDEPPRRFRLPSMKSTDRLTLRRPSLFSLPDQATQQQLQIDSKLTRASLSSLPDLIRRAGKVATNLDKGKTASRVAVNHSWFDDTISEDASSRHRSRMGASVRTGSGTSGMSSFPLPPIPSLARSGVLAEAHRNSDRLVPIGRFEEVTFPSTRNLAGDQRNMDVERGRTEERMILGMSRSRFWTIIAVVVVCFLGAVIFPAVFVTMGR